MHFGANSLGVCACSRQAFQQHPSSKTKNLSPGSLDPPFNMFYGGRKKKQSQNVCSHPERGLQHLALLLPPKPSSLTLFLDFSYVAAATLVH